MRKTKVTQDQLEVGKTYEVILPEGCIVGTHTVTSDFKSGIYCFLGRCSFLESKTKKTMLKNIEPYKVLNEWDLEQAVNMDMLQFYDGETKEVEHHLSAEYYLIEP